MKIAQIIDIHYNDLLATCTTDKSISYSKTEEDILHDVLITAINRYGDDDILEEEGLQYIKKTLYYEKHFQYNRKKNDPLIFTENMEHYDTETEP